MNEHDVELTDPLVARGQDTAVLTPSGTDLGTPIDQREEYRRLVEARDLELVPGRLRVLTDRELAVMTFPPAEFLIEPWFKVGDDAMLSAWRGVGKTQCSVGIATAVGTGTHFLRWTAPKPRRVLFIDGEMGAAALQERFAEARRRVGAQPTDNIRILSFDQQDEVGLPNLADPEGQAMLDPLLDGVELVILDNLDTLCQSTFESKSPESWDTVQRWILGLRRRRIAVLLIHHCGKSRTEQRGTSKREDVLHISILLKQPSNYSTDQGCRFELSFTKARGLRGEALQAVRPFEAWLRGEEWSMREIEDAEANRAAELRDRGYTQRQIASEMGVSAGKVNYLLKAAVGVDGEAA